MIDQFAVRSPWPDVVANVYWDLNGNYDLSDDGHPFPISPALQLSRNKSTRPAHRLAFVVPYASGARVLYEPLDIRVFAIGDSQNPLWDRGDMIDRPLFVQFRGAARHGYVSAADGLRVWVLVFDADADGLFNGPADVVCADVDQNDGLACGPGGSERFAPGGPIELEGSVLHAIVAPSGTAVELSPDPPPDPPPIPVDHGDVLSSATLMPIGPPLPGKIGDSIGWEEGQVVGDGVVVDTDVFRIDLHGSAVLEVRTSGPTDTRGRLLDGTGTELASDDNNGPGGHNFLIRANLDAGIYYVAVTGELGDYAVMARLGDAPDHGDTMPMSTLLTLYAEDDLDQVSPTALLAAPGKIAPTAADVDVFRLDVPLDATEVTIRSAGGTDVFARLLDSSMNEIAADASEGNFRMEAMLDAGIYYVVVTASEKGTYRVLAWGDSAACPCAVDGARDHGGKAESSTLMPIGPPRAGTIGDADDVDVFRIDLHGSATLEVRTSGPTDTRGELLDGTGARIASDDDSGPAGHNFLVRADLEAGVYYVSVTGEPGDYAVMARLGDAPDHGDTMPMSTLLTLYAEDDLDQVSPTALLATPGKIAPTTADVDVFRLDVPADGTNVTIRSAGSTEVVGRVIKPRRSTNAHFGGTRIAEDSSDGNFRIELTQLDAGIYYVWVLSPGGSRRPERPQGETGTYRVLAWSERTEACRCDDDRMGRGGSVHVYGEQGPSGVSLPDGPRDNAGEIRRAEPGATNMSMVQSPGALHR